jgi:hypothetical protein
MRANFATVDELTDLLRYVAEDVSLGFERWGDRYVRGPSLYFVVASGTRFDRYADPLGSNRWPIETVRNVDTDLADTVRVARDVAFECDGAIVVTADGTVQEQMVRVRAPLDGSAPPEYPEWMSAKHLSALEVSTLEAVLSAVTLSEENGRVTVFEDGQYEDHRRAELGDPWRTN